jgi:hypothetical protein
MKQHTAVKFPHLFTVTVLDKLPGIFKPRRYLYHCARCKWSFVVNEGRRAAIRPIAEEGVTLTRDEVVARAETFAAGPCPAMRVLAEAHHRLNGSNGRAPAGAVDSRPQPVARWLLH